MQANELEYVRDKVVDTFVSKVADRVAQEYKDNPGLYDRFEASRPDPDTSEYEGRDVRLAAMWSIASIKTDTELVDSEAQNMISGDFGVDKEIMEQTTDGDIKWEKFGEWFTSEIPDDVADLLNKGRVNEAHALLSGRNWMTGEKVGEKYLRATKASMVLYLLGFDRICVDSRVFQAVKPALHGIVENKAYSHPPTETENRFRSTNQNGMVSLRQDAKPIPVISHSGDPNWDREKSYFEDKLKWNIDEYHALTTHIVDVIADESGVDRRKVPQVLFNLGRSESQERTRHKGLLERF